MTETAPRILVVDDSLVFRKVMCDLLAEIPGVEVVAQAPNGRIALQKLQDQKVDLVIMDMEMSDISGLEVLEEIKKRKLATEVILVSGFSQGLTTAAVRALNAGAFEFVPKPDAQTMEENRRLMESDLKQAVLAFGEHFRVRKIVSSISGRFSAITIPVQSEQSKETARRPEIRRVFHADLLVIGISTGGPPALTEIFTKLSGPLAVPVIIVQHIPPCFSEALAASISDRSGLPVSEARDGVVIEPGRVYLSPGGRQIKLLKVPESDRYMLRIFDDPPENGCRPSIDYFLISAVGSFKGKIAFLIMTGMGSDGLNGARAVHEAGGYIMAQSGETCVVNGMPKAVIDAGLADEIVPLPDIPAGIALLTGFLDANSRPTDPAIRKEPGK